MDTLQNIWILLSNKFIQNLSKFKYFQTFIIINWINNLKYFTLQCFSIRNFINMYVEMLALLHIKQPFTCGNPNYMRYLTEHLQLTDSISITRESDKVFRKLLCRHWELLLFAYSVIPQTFITLVYAQVNILNGIEFVKAIDCTGSRFICFHEDTTLD